MVPKRRPARGRNGTLIGVVLGLLATAGCPRRFDPRAAEIHSPNKEAEADYARARQTLEQGDPATAQKELSRFLAQHGDDPLAAEATLLQARAALSLKDPAQARDLVLPLAQPGERSGISAPPSEAVVARARYLLGLSLYHLGDLAGGRRLLQPFAEQIVDSDDGTELHAVLADILRRDGSPKDALREYDRYYHGAGVQKVEQAYVREQASRLIAALPPLDQPDWQRRFALLTDSAHAATSSGSRASIEPRTIVGLLLPLSGKDRALGDRVLRGALLGAELIGATGVMGNRQITDLRVRDGAATDLLGAAGALLDEGALVLIGSPKREGDASKLYPVTGPRGIPLIDLSPALDEGAPAGAVFHLLRSNAARARGLARFLAQKGLTSVAVLAPTTAYGKAMTQAFVAELTGKPVRVVGQLSYAESATTFTDKAQQLLVLHPEALFVPASVPQLELIAAQLAATGVIPTQNVPVKPGGVRMLLGTADGLGERLLRTAGRYLQGAVLAPISSGGVEVNDPALTALSQRYQQAYGEEPGALDALGYDAVRLIAVACQGQGQGSGQIPGQNPATPAGPAERRECSPSRIAAALPNLTLSGATGSICFDARGQRAGAPLLVRVEGAGLRIIPSPPQETCGAPELRTRTASR